MINKKFVELKLGQFNINQVVFRFWTQCLKANNGCIEFQGKKDKDGYGQFSIYNSYFRASRVAYFLYQGHIDNFLQVNHSCDNPICCNPEHLWQGTQKLNCEDCVTKGRWRTAKLYPSQVIEIAKLFSKQKLPIQPIANKYDVSFATIWAIACKKSWRPLLEPLGL